MIWIMKIPFNPVLEKQGSGYRFLLINNMYILNTTYTMAPLAFEQRREKN